MRVLKRKRCIAAAIGAGILFAGAASATTVTMNFDGMGSNEQVASYYEGGCSTFFGACASSGGPNYGVIWSGAQTSDITSSSSGTLSPPSAPNYIILTNPNGNYLTAIMEVPAGFGGSGFSFYYYGSPTVTVYSGLDGRYQIASQTFDTCDSLGFCLGSLGFTGTARSAVFTGPGIFDNVAFTKAVPEPAALGMFSLGVLLIGGFVGLRRRVT